MSTQPPVGRSIENVIGNELASDAAPRQRGEIENFIAEDQGRHVDGIAELARKVLVEEAAGKIDAGVPVLLARLRQGQHRRRERQTAAGRISVLDLAEQRYQAKLADFARHHADPNQWGPNEALDYAIDSALFDLKAAGEDRDELEQRIRERLTLPQPSTTADEETAARWQAIRRYLERTRLDHPLHLAARETCSPRQSRSDLDALQVLAYLEAIVSDTGLDQAPPEPEAPADEDDTGEDPPPDTLAA